MQPSSSSNISSDQIYQSQIDLLRFSRAQQIVQYLSGDLHGMKRNEFVSDMIRDHNLRLAVVLTREEKQLIDSTVSERSLTLLEQLCEAISHLNSFFPNSPGLEGYHGSSKCDSPRQFHLDSAVKFAKELFNEGQLEDLALENRWIAEKNFENSNKLNHVMAHIRKTAAYDRLLEEMVVPGLRSDPSTGALHPIKHAKPQERLPLSHPFSELSVSQNRNTDSEFTKNLLLTPIMGSNPLQCIAEKLVEVEKLITRVVTTDDEQAQELLRQAFLQYLPSAIHGPAGKYSANYFKSLLNLMADAANTNDQVWNVLRPGLLLSLESRIYGVSGDLIPETDRQPVLITALERLPARLESKEVFSVLNQISTVEIPSVAWTACSVFMLLPSVKAVPLLINVMLTHQGPDLKLASEQTADPYDSYGFVNPELMALLLLSRCDVDCLQSAQLLMPEDRVSQRLKDYTNEYIQIRASAKAVSADFTDIDSVLYPLLVKIDRDLAAIRFKERLSAWRGSETTFPALVSMIDEHFGSRFAEEVIRALAVLCKNSRYPRVPFDLIKVIRDDWKVPEKFVNQFGGKDLSALIYR